VGLPENLRAGIGIRGRRLVSGVEMLQIPEDPAGFREIFLPWRDPLATNGAYGTVNLGNIFSEVNRQS